MKKPPVKKFWFACALVVFIAAFAWWCSQQRLPLMVGSSRVSHLSEISFSIYSKKYSLVSPETMTYLSSSVRGGNVTKSYKVSSKINSGLWGSADVKFSDGRTESYSSIVSQAGLVLYIPGIYEFIDDPDVIEVFFSDPLPQELGDFLVKAHRDRDEISGPPPPAKVIYSSEDIKLNDPLKKLDDLTSGWQGIGGRDEHWLVSPSLRTGLADFPHPALRLMVYLRED